jgi:hypothetical protein
MRIRHALPVAVVALGLAAAPDARACSCVQAEVVFEDTEVAYVGRVVDRTRLHAFIEVQKVYKGNVKGRVRHLNPQPKPGRSGAAMCERVLEVGDRVGVMARPDEQIGSCDTVTPSRMRELAGDAPEETPQPTPEPPPPPTPEPRTDLLGMLFSYCQQIGRIVFGS